MLQRGDRPVYESGHWEIDLSRRELRADGVAIPLGCRAFEIIAELVQSAGELVTKDELMGRVWSGAVVEESALHVHICAVRKALGPDRAMLRTVFGRGYHLQGNWTIRPESVSADPAGPERLPSPASPVAFSTNFPMGIPDLIGRQAAAQHVQDLLSAYRAVTLTGPAGIGKTALALKTARSLFPTFDGDGFIVELASLSEASLVPSAVAGVLALNLGGDGICSEAVARAIGTKKLLLVLDNCEHVIDAAAELVETIIRMCPHTSILATSREVLRIDGEHAYRVTPLDVPLQDQEEASSILGCSSVQLFIARTSALRSDFNVNVDNLPVIAGICRRLDGIPLAIEFAAARAAVLGVQEIASRLDDRFRLLTAGRRTALPRHQTLRATLDWSYELLPEPERCLLDRLGIFPARFTLEAATAIMSDTGTAVPAVVEGIANLVSKSLVILDGSVGAPRWRMLETIRAYALEKLADSGEAEQIARRHAEFFRDLFAPMGFDPQSAPLIDDVVRYAREIDNVRAALDWSFSPGGDPAIGVALTVAFVPVWMHLSLNVECREYIERALRSLGPDSNLSASARMQLYIALGPPLILTMGSIESTRTVLANAIELAESLDDTDAQLRTLWVTWAMHFSCGECHKAQSAAEQFSRIARRSGDPATVLIADRYIGNTLCQEGKLRDAERCFARVLELYIAPKGRRDTIVFRHDQRVVARAMLARVLWLRGFLDQAIDQARASLEEAQATDHKPSLFWVIHNAVCPVTLATGDLSAVERAVAMLIDLAATPNVMNWKVKARCQQARLLIKRGEFAAGLALLREALDTCAKTGWMIVSSEFQGALAEGLAGLGRGSEALAAIEQAIMRADRSGEAWYLPELLRLKGELLLQKNGQESFSAAEGCFTGALERAEQQDALFWSLRAAVSLAHLKVKQGRADNARQVLEPVYARFTESFQTPDLRSARSMLETLGRAETLVALP